MDGIIMIGRVKRSYDKVYYPLLLQLLETIDNIFPVYYL